MKRVLIAIAGLAALVAVAILAVLGGWFGNLEVPGDPVPDPRPQAVVEAGIDTQRATVASLQTVPLGRNRYESRTRPTSGSLVHRTRSRNGAASGPTISKRVNPP